MISIELTRASAKAMTLWLSGNPLKARRVSGARPQPGSFQANQISLIARPDHRQHSTTELERQRHDIETLANSVL